MMKKTLCSLLMAVLLAVPLIATAQCTTAAGTIQSWQAIVCAGGDFSAVLNNDATLDGDDVRLLVAFTGPGPVSGTVLAVSATGTFPYNPLFAANSPFFIAPVAGNNDGSGGVDWSDPCLSVGPAQTVIYEPEIQVSVNATLLTCMQQPSTLSASSPNVGVTFLWIGPNGFIATGATAFTTLPGTYCVVVTDQNGCTAQACVDVIPQPLFTVDVPPVSNLSCSNPSVTMVPQVSPPGPQFLYFWTGPCGFSSTQQDLTTNVPGFYTLAVIDQTNGCVSVHNVDIGTDNPIVPIAQNVVCAGDTMLFTAQAPTLQQPYAYAWSNGSTSSTLEITAPLTAALYLTLTDGTGCSTTACLDPAYPLPLAITFYPQLITCDLELWTVSVTGGSWPFTYDWTSNVLPDGNIFQAHEAGIYGLTVTDANGCVAVLDTFLEVDPGQCAVIRGQVFRDSNLDCILNGGEPGLGGWLVEATGNGSQFLATTDASGFYQIEVYPGVYDVAVQTPDPAIWMPCVASVNLGTLAAGDTVTADFALKPLVDCPLLHIDITTPVLRRCLSNNYYYGSYCNDGTVTATDAYFDISLDAFMTLEDASLPYTALGNNVFRFEVGDITPGDCNTFNLRVSISCDAVLGQTHCTEAHIYPDTLCAGAPGWSGANVAVTGECDQDSVRFTIKNTGGVSMSVPLEYVVIEDAVMFMTAGNPPLGPGDEIKIVQAADGATWRVVANQEPNHPSLPGLPTAWLEGCAGGSGTISTGFVTQFSDGDGDSFLDIDCTMNIGSYDPNDKQGFPVGYGPAHFIKPATPLEYLIRFQNTGTDTAFNVVLRDTLSPWLDALSVQPGASSHSYRFELYGEGIVKFSFENILLPDSNVNVAASNGFVKFSVQPRADVPLETDIFNRAAIYFDFNQPVLTNTTVHRISEDFLVSAWHPARPELSLRITPHPLQEEAWLEISGLEAGQPLQLRWFDSQGRLVRSENAVAPTFRLRRDGMPVGLYFLEISDKSGLSGRAKVMVR